MGEVCIETDYDGLGEQLAKGTIHNRIGETLVDRFRGHDPHMLPAPYRPVYPSGEGDGKLLLTIHEAHFNKDNSDWIWSKQDPYIRFIYNGKYFDTRTQQDAGKHAYYNETHTLDNIEREVRNGN